MAEPIRTSSPLFSKKILFLVFELICRSRFTSAEEKNFQLMNIQQLVRHVLLQFFPLMSQWQCLTLCTKISIGRRKIDSSPLVFLGRHFMWLLCRSAQEMPKKILKNIAECLLNRSAVFESANKVMIHPTICKIFQEARDCWVFDVYRRGRC